MESLVLHEDHISNFKSTDEVLDGGTEVAATGPHILNEGDLIRLNAELLSQPAEVEFNALVLEEYVLIWVVENLDAKHNEPRVMTASQTNVIEVIEADTELGADQRVGGRVKLASDAVRLEAINTGSDKVNIVSPSSDNWVSLDGLAWYSSRGHGAFKTYRNVRISFIRR